MNRRRFLLKGTAVAGAIAAPALLRGLAAANETRFRVRYFPVAAGMGSRDVTAAPDGAIWFCGQRNGMMGRLDPGDGSHMVSSSVRMARCGSPRAARMPSRAST
jgi:virginiamycin B lyase